MIDPKVLAYDFDEEEGFREPVTPHAEPQSWTPSQKVFLALVVIGGVAFFAQVLGLWKNGGWIGLVASFGLLGVGSAGWYIAKYRRLAAGIHNDRNTFSSAQARGGVGWVAGLLMTAFYVLLYFRYPIAKLLGTAEHPRDLLAPMVAMVDPLSELVRGKNASGDYWGGHWFLYGFVYTLAILVFGVRMFLRYRHNRYQLIRSGSVMFFQLVLAFLVPSFLVLFQQPEFYFSYFWPLKYSYFFPGEFPSDPLAVKRLFLYWAVVMSFVATPVLTYLFGKRWYCSWVCGCGGLAETAGDPWRQLSSKSTTSWWIERWMIHAVLVAIVVLTALLWTNSALEGEALGKFSQAYSELYGLWIGSIFSGVIGVGFYPLMGSRVWCRFGCPMAAVLGIVQRVKSRFRITTNGSQCMSCGNCSTYCEMGIDVRAYAQRGANIVRASCVGCGICSAVCPRGVLKLENGPARDRYVGDGNPIATFIRDATSPPSKNEG
ncbi:MAG: 4Fe-4S binding protein [Planctomycetes bacterium]|nr:4Fe-4S binding protein [Planctomycetota bacterium]